MGFWWKRLSEAESFDYWVVYPAVCFVRGVDERYFAPYGGDLMFSYNHITYYKGRVELVGCVQGGEKCFSVSMENEFVDKLTQSMHEVICSVE